MTFTWRTRLKYAMLAFLAGWLAGWLVTIPFVVAMAWRYVDAHVRLLPNTVAEGLVIWGAFSLVMSMAGFAAPGAAGAALRSTALDCALARASDPLSDGGCDPGSVYRMGLLSGYYFLHPGILYDMFSQRAQRVPHCVCPGDDVGVHRAGETTALRAGCAC